MKDLTISKKKIHVSAGALIDESGRVLLARRPEGKPMAGLWEFPGGKLEPEEDSRAALVRELREELGIDLLLQGIRFVASVEHSYPDFDIVLYFFVCREQFLS